MRIRAEYEVCGGILGDKIGYGKTATTIGLIDSTAQLPAPRVPRTELGSFIPAKGTLIIVPSNLLGQWLTELSKFVWNGQQLKNGWSPEDCPLKIFSFSTVTPLKGVTVQELAKADIVLCSYRLLFSPVYIQRRDEITAMKSSDKEDPLAKLVGATKGLLLAGDRLQVPLSD